jgi:DNA-binding LytR/AlgR family response regulator
MIDLAPPFVARDVAPDPLGRGTDLAVLAAELHAVTVRLEAAERELEATLGTLASVEASTALMRERRLWIAARAALDAARRVAP